MIKIGNKEIKNYSEPFIIAEIGLEPKYINFLIKKQAKRDNEIDSLLSMEDF